MSAKECIQSNYQNINHQYHESQTHKVDKQDNHFEIEEDANNSRVSIEEKQDEDEAAAIHHRIQQNNDDKHYLNGNSPKLLLNKFDKFSQSCNLPSLENHLSDLSQQLTNISSNNLFEKDPNTDVRMNQPFLAFQERPRSDSQRLPNISINCDKKQYSNLQMKVANSSLNNSDSTLFRSDMEKQSKLIQAQEGGSESQLLNSSNEQYQQLSTDKAILIRNHNQNVSNSMDEDTSSLSASVPHKKQKKSICKNSSPQSSTSQFNQQKQAVNRKKSNTVNTSIFSTTGTATTTQKKERNSNKKQKDVNNFNNLEQHSNDQNKLDDYISINNHNDTSCVADDSINNNDNLQSDKNQIQNKSKQSQNNPLEQQSKKIRFTPEEDEALINLIKIHGKKWKVISDLMDGKNETRIRNRYYSYIRKILKPGENTPSTTPTRQQENEFEQINQRQSSCEQNNPESFQENQGNPNMNQTNGISSSNTNNKVQKKEYQSTFQEAIQIQLNQNNNNNGYNNQQQDENSTLQQLQQSTSNHNPQFFNSTLFDSLNVLTLNNFEKDFNGMGYDASNGNANNHFQSNFHDSMLIQSNHQLLQFPFSSNNLNFDYLSHRIPSFKFLNGLEGSLANLDCNIGKQYFQTFKNSIQDFEAIDAEDFNQKFCRNGNDNNNPIFNSDAIIQEEEPIIPEQSQNYASSNKQNNKDTLQNFCPNRILKSFNTNHYEEPSPLIFANAQKRYDPKRFTNVNIQQAFNSQNPVSGFSVDEEMGEENNQEQHNTLNQNEELTYKSLTEIEKLQKIRFLNSQVENIQTLIEQCKQEILKEFLTKGKRNA